MTHIYVHVIPLLLYSITQTSSFMRKRAEERKTEEEKERKEGEEEEEEGGKKDHLIPNVEDLTKTYACLLRLLIGYNLLDIIM